VAGLVAPLISEARDSVVVFSEVHYNPAGSLDEEEFIELHNLFGIDIDLGNWELDGGVRFDFPAGTTIPAGGYLVVARNPAALQSATGYTSALGPWEGALKNGGETVSLMMDSIGPRTMDEVTYSDGGQWPRQPDGSGASLEKLNPRLPGNQAASWGWSSAPNGTPGAARTTTSLPQLSFNEIAGIGDPAFFVELYNTGDSVLQLAGYQITSSDETRTPAILSAGTLNAGSFTTLNAASLGYTPVDDETLFLLTPSGALILDAIKAGNYPKARIPDGTGAFLRPAGTTLGTPNSVEVETDVVINEILYHGYPTPGTDGQPAEYDTTNVIAHESAWRYENSGAEQAAGWSQLVHSGWPSGDALLGKESDASITIETPLYTEGQIAYYFETEFIHSGSTVDAQIKLTHKIDDGAVFYLNGVELGRYNMPTSEIDSSTLASGAINTTEQIAVFDAPCLVTGSNRLSVEVHQATSGSSDMVFGLQAEVIFQTVAATVATVTTESREEWIELYNKGTESIDLGGWALADAVEYTFPAGTQIAPGDYLVIGRDPTALQLKHPSLTVLGPWSGKLSNSDERIVLEDENGNTVDEVHYYDGGRWPAFSDGGGCSLELKDPQSDNAIPESWADSETDGEWTTYSYRATATDDGFGVNNFHEFILGMADSGEMLIDDVSVIEDPDGSATEFIQNGTFSSDAVGSEPAAWRLTGTHGLHGRTVVVEDDGNKVLKIVSTGYMREYHNQLQTTFANSEQVVAGQTYEISYRAKWLKGIDIVNTRLYFNWLSNTYRMETAKQWGTPGAENSKRVSNAGPTFSQFSHSPVIPAAGESVTVEAVVEDPDNVASVSVKYRVNTTDAFTSITLAHQGEGLYRGTLPGFSAGTLLQFYLEATDDHSTSAASSTFPAAGAASGAMIQWEDGNANTAVLHNLRLIMRPQDRQLMNAEIHRMSNYRFPCTLVVDESEVYYDIGVRLKGSAHGRNSTIPGLNLGFNAMQPFNGVHKSVAIEQGVPNQLFAKHLMSNAGKGMASSFDDPIRLVFPSDTLGNSAIVGTVLLSSSRYAASWRSSQFKDDGEGTVYNMELLYSPKNANDDGWKLSSPYTIGGSPEFTPYPQGKETYRWVFPARSNFGADNYDPIINLSTAFEQAPDNVGNYIDVDQWARTWAYLGVMGSIDLYTRKNYHNYRMYQRPEDGLLVALPWDMDRILEYNSDKSYGDLIGGGNLGAYLERPGVRRLFMQHMLNLCETVFSQTYASAWATHLKSKTGGTYAISGLNTRREHVLTQLPAVIPFAITSNGGEGFSVNASSTLIEGTGWVDVRTFQVNGNPIDAEWVDDENWQLTVPLETGANELLFTAYDLESALVGSDSITVTNSSIVSLASSNNLALVEIMYNPTDPSEEEIAAGYDSANDFEFLELLNLAATPINLGGARFTTGIEFLFETTDDSILYPNERIVLARNPEALAFRYGSPANVTGPYDGKLSNSGEQLILLDSAGDTLLDFTYGTDGDWPGRADGDGSSLVLIHPTADPAQPENWRASADYGGSPGTAEQGDSQAVVINEILSHSDTGIDWIELKNISSNTVDVSGWVLSDDPGTLLKFRIPEETELSPGEFLVLDETSFNNTNHPGALIPFSLSELGDELLLLSATSNRLSAFADTVDFGPADQDVTFIRHVLSTGEIDFPAASSPTPLSENSAPRIGPVIISEINYHPVTGAPEYIELQNITDSDVPLYDPAYPTNTWVLEKAVEFIFPESTTLAAHGHLIVCSTNPSLFRTRYDVLAETPVLGPYQGVLNDLGNNLKLRRPGKPELNGFVPLVLIDRVEYEPASPWPLGASGTGHTIERISTAAYGNDPANWRTSVNPQGTPGTVTQTDSDSDGLPDNWEMFIFERLDSLGSSMSDSDGDLVNDYVEYVAGTDPLDPTDTPRLEILWQSATGPTVQWQGYTASGPGYIGLSRRYTLKQTEQLGQWNSIEGQTDIPAADKSFSYAPSINSNEFYRLNYSLQ
jgi:spore coat protein CotH